MASGDFTGGYSNHVAARIVWSSQKGNGGSTVTATLYWQESSSAYHIATLHNGYSITINGNSSSGKGAVIRTSYGGNVALISHSVWVAYTGNKSISISGAIENSGVTTNGLAVGRLTASSTVALDFNGSVPNKPATPSVSKTIASETGDTVKISWTKMTDYNGNCGGSLYYIKNNGSATLLSSISAGVTEHTHTIPAGTGDTYKYYLTASNSIGSSTGDSSGTVTTNYLNPPVIADVATYNPYVTASLSVGLSGGSQLDGTTYMRKCSLYYGTTLLLSSPTPTANNTSVSLAYSAANYIAKLGSNKYSDTFKLVAWSENSKGTKSAEVEKTFTVNINSDGGATPTLAQPTFSGGILSNPATCFIVGGNITITSATGAVRRAPSGTTLSYKISVKDYGETNGTTRTISLSSAGTKDVYVTVTDSRGLSTQSTLKQFVVQSYSPPTISALVCSRSSSVQTSAVLSFTATYTPIYQYTSATVKGTQLNALSVTQYNVAGGSWINATNGMTLTNLNIETVYTINLRVADKVKTSNYITSSAKLPTVKKPLSMRKWGVGVMCIPQTSNAFEVNGNTLLTGTLTTTGRVTANGGVNIGYTDTNYKLSVASFISNDWIRTNGNTGWYSQVHGGGIHMSDTNWVRIYNNKKFYVSNTSVDAIYTAGGIKANDMTLKGHAVPYFALSETWT